MSEKTMKIKFTKAYTVQDGTGTKFDKDKTYELPEASARHYLNRKVAEEVKAEKKADTEPKPVDEEPELTAADVRKMYRADLDELAAQKGIDLQDFNVEDSKAYLIEELELE